MKISIEIENIRYGGGANTITKKSMSLDSVENVDIAIDEQIVTIEAENKSKRTIYTETLFAVGYPEQGSVEGMTTLKEKAKSVVSCAIGKVS